jgi:hypothetical protein
VIDENGRRHRLSWHVVQHGPVLLRGMMVLVHLDDMGVPAKVRLAS